MFLIERKKSTLRSSEYASESPPEFNITPREGYIRDLRNPNNLRNPIS